jgi:hypothetical protein
MSFHVRVPLFLFISLSPAFEANSDPVARPLLARFLIVADLLQHSQILNGVNVRTHSKGNLSR